MRIEHDLKLDFSDVLIRPKRSTLASRSEVSLEREFTFRNSHVEYKGIPIMAANMDGVGTFTIAEVLAQYGMFTCLVKNYAEPDLQEWIYTIGDKVNNNWAYSLGISNADLLKFSNVYKSTTDVDGVNRVIKYVCIDVANGYTERFVEFIKDFRYRFPTLVIIAGNVVTGEMTEELILNGVDIVKVGIGPGSVCTTRIKTGVGYPQLSAIVECADAAHGLGGHIIADGGCTSSGDVAKAFGAGADFVMLGSMFAGTDQGGGDIITKTFKTNELDKSGYHINSIEKYIVFYGMSSETANNKHFGGLKNYRSSEGRTTLIPYKGDIETVIQDILGGLRSCCTYVGATKLKELSKRTTFIRCSKTHNTVFEKNTIGK